jgi:hypothetical protein
LRSDTLARLGLLLDTGPRVAIGRMVMAEIIELRRRHSAVCRGDDDGGVEAESEGSPAHGCCSFLPDFVGSGKPGHASLMATQMSLLCAPERTSPTAPN